MTLNRSLARVGTLLVGLSWLLSGHAAAGPLLLCHPFATGGAESLPWGTAPTWNSPDPTYDTRRLTADVVRMLDATPSVLAHMETLRRATIYATRDAQLAADLLAAVEARANRRRAVATSPLAVFDAGYLVETYRQASQVYKWGMLSEPAKAAWVLRTEPTANGYTTMRQALATSASPEMEFAASLVAPGSAADEHRRRAERGAAPGSPLAAVMRAIASER